MHLPLVMPADLSPAQREIYDEIRAVIETRFKAFEAIDEHGRLIGPFNASVNYPAIGKASFGLTMAVNAMGILPPRPTEVAILVVAGFYKAPYEIYAHTAVAESIGMPLDRILALIANTRPSGLDAEEGAAFDMAISLCRGGPLPVATWRGAVEAFGRDGAAQLVFLVGLYAFVSVSLNGFDVPVPN